MPPLNLKAKKAEIAALLLELARDSKRSLIKERSRREQLIAEAVRGLTHWLNDIWKVVYEFRTNFRLAHTCLLFACDALDQIGNSCGGHVAPSSPLPRSHLSAVADAFTRPSSSPSRSLDQTEKS